MHLSNAVGFARPKGSGPPLVIALIAYVQNWRLRSREAFRGFAPSTLRAALQAAHRRVRDREMSWAGSRDSIRRLPQRSGPMGRDEPSLGASCETSNVSSSPRCRHRSHGPATRNRATASKMARRPRAVRSPPGVKRLGAPDLLRRRVGHHPQDGLSPVRPCDVSRAKSC
jgi:hypothetical protein